MTVGTRSVELTRDELYRQVWETPMMRLAHQYGITGNGLAKICDRLNVPYPPRGYWAKKAAGKKVITYRLPDADTNIPKRVVIRPTPLPEKPPEISAEIESTVASARAAAATIGVSNRLVRPHPIIASWLADHERRKIDARLERDPWRRNLIAPVSFSEADRRRHRILDALLKAIEREGGHANQGENRVLFAVVQGQRIDFQLREKLKQVRRPLTDEEKRWQSSNDKGWRQELSSTGKLVLSIKTHVPGLQMEWLESDSKKMETLLPDIVATFVTAGPLLAEQKRQRDEIEHQRRITEQNRYEEQQRQRRDENRWARFTDLARQWHDTKVARRFFTALKNAPVNPDLQIGGTGVREWFAWAELHLQSHDPLVNGVEAIFNSVADVSEWTRRD